MSFSTLHREDVLAQIRKLYGSAAEFERRNGFPTKSVNEVLRGRANARVRTAIENLLTSKGDSMPPEHSGATRKIATAHGLSAEAK